MVSSDTSNRESFTVNRVLRDCHAMENEQDLVNQILPFPTNVEKYSKNLSITVSTTTTNASCCTKSLNIYTRHKEQQRKIACTNSYTTLIRRYWNTSTENVCHLLNQIPQFITPCSNSCVVGEGIKIDCSFFQIAVVVSDTNFPNCVITSREMKWLCQKLATAATYLKMIVLTSLRISKKRFGQRNLGT